MINENNIFQRRDRDGCEDDERWTLRMILFGLHDGMQCLFGYMNGNVWMKESFPSYQNIIQKWVDEIKDYIELD